ncbi:MAG: DUF3224 domain-containing protein [Alphaproteobacteria bacterium]|nr:DUF3224 domain-containing protein [Alphaproteobacteria bacterium]MBU2270106.1 DUF3224 domain-containing protein [Alphaproteobacteria bacterium]MBU2417980.1 DUF3224 domain-containing protein [Alphaproteobacteria bacterium]
MTLVAVLVAGLLAAIPLSTQAQEPVVEHARGTFDVTITPVPPSDGAPPGAPGRMTLSKVFHGDIDGTAEGEMLATLVGQSGAYVALERVHGRVGGRTGSFALAHRGMMDDGAQDLSIAVVPGSGTGELAGIAGTFRLVIEDGVHRYDLEYSLPAP